MKKYLIAGLIILIPILLTIMLFVFLVDLFTSPFLNIAIDFLMKFEQALPLLKNPALLTFVARVIIIIMLCILIFLLGVVARWFIFKSLLNIANKILSKIPFVKSIYKSLKDIISSFMAQERKAFTKTAMVTFPSKDSYCVGFESGEIPQECQSKVDKKLKPVFLPTAPHPISGYLIMVPVDEIYPIDMKNEDAVKFTVSCGLILPGEKQEDVLEK